MENKVDVRIAAEDPRSRDVLELLERHLAFAMAMSPRQHVHALDVSGLVRPDVTFFTARIEGDLLGVGALKELDRTHGEIKSMHTRADQRGRGVGAAIVRHLLGVACARGYVRLSLETGAHEPFVAARALYAKFGFEPCPPFGSYTENPYSVCMTTDLRPRSRGGGD